MFLKDKKDNGEEVEVGLISSQEGTFSSISSTAIKGLDLIIDYMEEEQATGVDAKINVKVGDKVVGSESIIAEIK